MPKKNHPTLAPGNLANSLEKHAILVFRRPGLVFFLAENVTFQAKWWETNGKTMDSDMEAQEPGGDDQGVCGRIPPVRMGSHAKTLVKSTFPACPVMVECISAILPLRRREKCNVSRKIMETVGETAFPDVDGQGQKKYDQGAYNQKPSVRTDFNFP